MEHYAMGRERRQAPHPGRPHHQRQQAGRASSAIPSTATTCSRRSGDNVKIESKLAQTEVFGPTINIISVDGFEEAIRAANGTPYGPRRPYTNDARSILRFKTEIVPA